MRAVHVCGLCVCWSGIHYIGEMRNNTVARLMVQQLTEGQLQWVDLIDEFDVVSYCSSTY